MNLSKTPAAGSVKRAPLLDLKFEEKDDPQNPGDGIWMIPSYGNMGVVETKQGLVVVDVPMGPFIAKTIKRLHDTFGAAVHTIFLTHGHADHAFCLNPLFEYNEKQGGPPPRVIAQRNILKRFNRYRMLQGFNDHINREQFAVPEGISAFPLPDRNPDITFDGNLSTRVGDIDFHAYHAEGETDDHLWVWVPEKKAVFSGDLLIWTFPNVGNPFKVQRYTLEWAEGLEAIVAKQPEILIPGHGPVLQGRDRIRKICLTVSSALRYLHDEVVKRLNAGMGYEDILHDIEFLPEWSQKNYLVPRYGCPSFVIHGILRQYTGWYDGNPSNLFAPKKSEIAREVTELVGAEKMAVHAHQLQSEGREQMALQFTDMALAGEPEPALRRSLHRLKAELLGSLGDRESSFIARNIYYTGYNREIRLADADPEND